MDARLKTPFRLLLVGPSGSGKTSWVMKLTHWSETLFDRKPAYVVYYYNIWQNAYGQMRNVDEFRQGIPTREEIENLSVYSERGGSLVIIDDQLKNINADLSEIFMVAGRHSDVSLVFLSQNLFPKDQHFRNISLQSTYIVLMKKPRDSSSINHLARQLSPSNSRFIISSYVDATEKNPYSYFFIDLHQETDEKLRYRTNVLPHEQPHIAYVPKAKAATGSRRRAT